MNGQRVICINDSQRPKEIPIESWVKFGDKYTVDKLYRILHPKQYGSQGISLKELPIDFPPYKFFGIHRFKPLDSDELLLDILEREMVEEDILECVE